MGVDCSTNKKILNASPSNIRSGTLTYGECSCTAWTGSLRELPTNPNYFGFDTITDLQKHAAKSYPALALKQVPSCKISEAPAAKPAPSKPSLAVVPAVKDEMVVSPATQVLAVQKQIEDTLAGQPELAGFKKTLSQFTGHRKEAYISLVASQVLFGGHTGDHIPLFGQSGEDFLAGMKTNPRRKDLPITSMFPTAASAVDSYIQLYKNNIAVINAVPVGRGSAIPCNAPRGGQVCATDIGSGNVDTISGVPIYRSQAAASYGNSNSVQFVYSKTVEKPSLLDLRITTFFPRAN